MTLIRVPHSSERIAASEITPAGVALNRRAFLANAAVAAAAAGLTDWTSRQAFAATGGGLAKLPGAASAYNTIEKITSYQDASTYNNYYEFGTDKSDPARNASSLRPRPWTVTVEGMVNKPKTFGIEDLLKLSPMQERIYRLRCVEGWSMVIPWVGYSLSELIKQVEPNTSAKYVEFITLSDPKQMPGLRSSVLDWPYVEGLRLDEAMHPLALLTFGMYGEVLPNQSGAPVRMVVPWKYGFKSGKSIVKIRFTDRIPQTSWYKAAPQEYGFYSNVNPLVDHPRWSQASERRIGEDGIFKAKRKTLMFNGYDQVASLYAGMDLKRYF